ncbi:hypothetical protein BDFB_013254 [Asbolus verrucosus]|uniref:Uncharacterized protein n=1 Tax=Asbolus verrucosus TaxID=1661398 RepID=A0A482W7M8_ASBVE|nr:hypothetical protein BDFB_013254 [Asbolus verrucosus]
MMLSKMVTDFKAVNNYLSKVDWKIVLSAPSVVENWCTFKDIKRSSTKPWINGRILKLINKKRALWRAFKRTRTEGDFRIRREFSNELSYIIKDARVAYEKRIADQKDPKSFYKYIRSKLSGPVTTPGIKDVDGGVLDNDEAIANIFANTFSKSFIVEPNTVIPYNNYLPERNVPARLKHIEFSEDDIREKINKLKRSKSPGPDNISALVLTACVDSIVIPLHIIMNQVVYIWSATA